VKTKWRVVIVILAVILGLALLMVLRIHRRPRLYRVVVLPSLGGNFTRPDAINDRGQVVGVSETADGDFHLFFWDKERGIEDLGDAHGGRFDINNAGQIAGTTEAADESKQAFIRDPNGAMRLLGTLGGSWSGAVTLNNHGQVAGTSEATDGSQHVFFWDRATGMRDVIAFSGQDGYVRTINDAGLVWGHADTPARGHQPFLWDPNEGLLGAGALPSTDKYTLHDLNNHSRFLTVHRFRPTEGRCAVLWGRQTGFKKLWRLEGSLGGRSGPPLVNDVNQVVYEEEQDRPLKLFGRTFFRNRPLQRQRVLWDPDCGRIVLDGCLPWSMRRNFTICDLNNAGAILGYSVKGRESIRAILLEPIPEKWSD